jgi:hypothetical protein
VVEFAGIWAGVSRTSKLAPLMNTFDPFGSPVMARMASGSTYSAPSGF